MEYYLPDRAKFWLLLTLLIPSIVCSIFVLYFLLFDRTLRRLLNNHVIILVVALSLLCQLTNYPWMLYFYNNGSTWEDRSLLFCEIWGYLDWGVYLTQTILFAWATIERHILIFYDSLVSTRKRRLIFHYIPLFICLIYPLTFYFILTFFPGCENGIWDSYVCVSYCFYDSEAISLWQTILHQIAPNIIIVVSSIGLLVRIIYRKYRLHRSIQWRKHRKMTIQLLSISLVYLFLSFPTAMTYLSVLINPSLEIDPVFDDTINFVGYFIMLLLPFVCVLSFSEFHSKIYRIFSIYKRGRIEPLPNTMYFTRTVK